MPITAENRAKHEEYIREARGFSAAYKATAAKSLDGEERRWALSEAAVWDKKADETEQFIASQRTLPAGVTIQDFRRSVRAARERE